MRNSTPEVEKIQQEEFQAKDRQKAQHIMLFSVLICLVVAILAYFLPL